MEKGKEGQVAKIPSSGTPEVATERHEQQCRVQRGKGTAHECNPKSLL